jgi:dolichol-phosphate mannosyltransferase
MARLDIVIPVYNEGRNITRVLDSLVSNVKTPFRVLICYDHDQDDTLPAVEQYKQKKPIDIEPVKNLGRGPHGAVMSGFAACTADAVLVMAADDDYNAGIIDELVAKHESGCDVVVPSRFMKGGSMKGCRPLKAFLVRATAVTLRFMAHIPVHDPTNGFRLFSRRVIEEVVVESREGFTYSIELLVKCHRLGLRIDEVPAQWFERELGTSRFMISKWAAAYLRWYLYAFGTTYLHLGPETVIVKDRTAFLPSGNSEKYGNSPA